MHFSYTCAFYMSRPSHSP